MLRRVRALTRADDVLLDAGCGTGSEAVQFARLGRLVVGCDVAPRMLALARAKAAAQAPAVAARLSFVSGSAGEASRAWLPPGRDEFDLAYSAYGVLNLEEEPAAALAALAGVVRPGGHVVVGTLNPTFLLELVVWPFAGRLKGFRKAAQPVVELKVGHGRPESVPCRLPSNRRLAADGAAAGLRLVEEVGLHVLLPPPSEGLLRRMPGLVALVNRLEARFESRRPASRLGYFSLLVFRREP